MVHLDLILLHLYSVLEPLALRLRFTKRRAQLRPLILDLLLLAHQVLRHGPHLLTLLYRVRQLRLHVLSLRGFLVSEGSHLGALRGEKGYQRVHRG